MKKIFLFAATATILAGAAFVATAESEKRGMPPHKAKMMKEVDTNSDGLISKDEFVSHAGKRFSKIDADNDGNATKDEMHKYHEAKKAEHEKYKKEGKEGHDKRFDEMDSDKDGKISKEEMKKHRESKKWHHMRMENEQED